MKTSLRNYGVGDGNRFCGSDLLISLADAQGCPAFLVDRLFPTLELTPSPEEVVLPYWTHPPSWIRIFTGLLALTRCLSNRQIVEAIEVQTNKPPESEEEVPK